MRPVLLSALVGSLALPGCVTANSKDVRWALSRRFGGRRERVVLSTLPVRPVCTEGRATDGRGGRTDGFCRDVTSAGVTLVDWDGFLANPAVSITVTPPKGLTYPTTLSITTDEARIYFDPNARPGRASGACCGPPTGSP